MTRRFTKAQLARWREAQADRVRNLRARFALTQSALAGLCGVDRRTLVRWEGGASTPTASAMAVLRALEVHGVPQAVRRWAAAGGLDAIVAHAVGSTRKAHGKKAAAATPARAEDGRADG